MVYYTRKFWTPIVFKFLFRQVEKKIKKGFEQTHDQSQKKTHPPHSSFKKKNPKMQTDDLGEYIDYEEIE